VAVGDKSAEEDVIFCWNQLICVDIMAELNNQQKNNQTKSPHAEREEKILTFWKERGIFEKSLKKTEGGKEFVFFEGPPTANGLPGIHHLEARAFKDAIPRYKTMCGFHVRRKGGWDTHGLPVELQVEKELGLKSKKEIEAYGIGAFNEKCKESVWKHVHEWADFTNRMGYWVDLKDPYITYKSSYIESLWNIVKTIDEKKLLYKDYKVVPWCPRCGTGLSSHELAQGYQDVKDLAVTVKFRITNIEKIFPKTSDSKEVYLLAWTTTPWTLPGNVALAVNPNIEYVQVAVQSPTLDLEYYVLAKDRTSVLGERFKDAKILETIKGKELIGLEYEPLYSFLQDSISGAEKEKLSNAYKVYAADFVTTTDGTGIVHTAVMYGQDDFELGTKVGLPRYHLVNEDGTFKKVAGFLAGKFVRDEATDVEIIKDLANRPDGSLLFHKEKHQHSYPFCWRCKTSLIYFARDSWYIRMSSLRKELIKENEGIHWEPAYIKDGRFGEWLREIKDWAISRERYWGTPLPVWICGTCQKSKVVGSVQEIAQKSRNTYHIMRHGEAENNTEGILNSQDRELFDLTSVGEEDVNKTAISLKGKGIDLIYHSSFLRARRTAAIIQEALGFSDDKVIIDERLNELDFGDYDGKKVKDLSETFPFESRFEHVPPGAERYGDVKKRTGDFLYEIDGKYVNKTILIITHATPAMMLLSSAKGLDRVCSIELEKSQYINNSEIRLVDFSVIPHNAEYELDLHRPHIDEVKLSCACGGTMSRVKEVMDVWFDSGSMPFAQDHYPFVKGGNTFSRFFSEKQDLAYPADFISEAIDQTRGWFYTLHAVGILMGKGKAFKNVICLGHILDAHGKKMSKSVGNVISPWEMMDKYGADALRYWMYSVNQPGDSKNFEEKTVDEIVKKVFNLAGNVLSFYKMYGGEKKQRSGGIKVSVNILDCWIITRLNQITEIVTRGLDAYTFQEPTRSIRDFVGDLSQWYIRRSRDRFKGSDLVDKEMAILTTRYVLITLAKIMAPFSPFFADYLYQEVGGGLESVHLETWPAAEKIDSDLIANMETVRTLCSKGLEARMAAKINIRQPLSKLKVKNQKSKSLADNFVGLIKDEVNVKEVVFGVTIEKDVELDTTITPTLKEEGMTRELIRAIQDLRKEKGLSMNDKAVLILDTNGAGRKFVEDNEKQVKAACTISEVRFGSVVGEPVVTGDVEFKVTLTEVPPR